MREMRKLEKAFSWHLGGSSLSHDQYRGGNRFVGEGVGRGGLIDEAQKRSANGSNSVRRRNALVTLRKMWLKMVFAEGVVR